MCLWGAFQISVVALWQGDRRIWGFSGTWAVSFSYLKLERISNIVLYFEFSSLSNICLCINMHIHTHIWIKFPKYKPPLPFLEITPIWKCFWVCSWFYSCWEFHSCLFFRFSSLFFHCSFLISSLNPTCWKCKYL